MTLPGYPEAAPLAGLAGGVLIGLAAAVMLLGLGRIAGVSGIAAKAAGLGGSGIARGGAWTFLIGLPLGALVVSLAQGGIAASFASAPVLVIAGLLVGMTAAAIATAVTLARGHYLLSLVIWNGGALAQQDWSGVRALAAVVALGGIGAALLVL